MTAPATNRTTVYSVTDHAAVPVGFEEIITPLAGLSCSPELLLPLGYAATASVICAP